MQSVANTLPILHLSGHGGEKGIALTNGDLVTWARLRELLVPINESFHGYLLLCLSTCEGFQGIRMAVWPLDGPPPYLALVGTAGSPEWSDTAVAYSAFYHRLMRGASFQEALEAMRAASGHPGWTMESAKDTRQWILNELASQLNPSEAQQKLEASAENGGVAEAANSLEADD